jgi:hypothetical protein
MGEVWVRKGERLDRDQGMGGNALVFACVCMMCLLQNVGELLGTLLPAHTPSPCPPCPRPSAMQLLHSYSGTVAATLSGHAHRDGYARDEKGIHHRVCKAVLETPPGQDCYALVDVFADRIVVRGQDTFESAEWAV